MELNLLFVVAIGILLNILYAEMISNLIRNNLSKKNNWRDFCSFKSHHMCWACSPMLFSLNCFGDNIGA